MPHIGQKLRSMLPCYLRHAVVAVLVLTALGVVTWAGVRAWQYYPCRETNVNLVVGSPGCPSLLLDVVPLIVALGFWAAGLAMWFTGHRGSMIGFFLLCTGTLAAGKLSSLNSDAGGRLFYLLLAWLAPLLLQFHLKLLDQSPGRLERIALGVLCGLAAIWSLPFLLWTIVSLEQRGWFAVLRLGVRLTFISSLVVVVAFLIHTYRERASSVARRRIRLIFFGILLACTPLSLFYLLPDTLGLAGLPHEEWTFPSLLLVPLTYVYSLLRRRLARTEVALRRAVVYYLLIILVLGINLAALGALTAITADMTIRLEQVGLGFLLSIGVLLLFAPLRQGIERLTNWVWYGREIAYVGFVEQLVESLSLALDRETLRRLLIEKLMSVMHLSKGALLIKDQDDRLTLLGYAGFDLRDVAACQWPGNGHLTTYLQTVAKPVTHDQVKQALAGITCYPGERVWLSRPDVAFWLPLVSGGELQGLLLIGLREEEDIFAAVGERTLATLARQSGIAAQNVRLMEQVQAGRQDLARAHQQLLVGRERERRRLAHDLHDGVVQQLIGISYQIAEGRRRVDNGSDPSVAQRPEEMASTLEVIRRGVLGVVTQLRGMISELRPAGLEELGLTTALEGYVAHLRRDGGAEAEIHLNLDESEVVVQDPIAICLFRVAQEALRNALKHASAKHITVSLRLLADAAILCVQDDGCGFHVPSRLSQLTQTGHFGLMGMSERVTWAGGQLFIRSEPGEGTEVRIKIPLNGGVVGYGGINSRTAG
jgi:signal transduction histidine kinase